MSSPLFLSVAVAILLIVCTEAVSPNRIHGSSIAPKHLSNTHSRHAWFVILRGGSDLDESGEYDSDDEEEVEEDIIIEDDEDEYDSEVEEEEEDVVMVKSAVKASQKARAKQTAAVKKTMSEKLSVKKTKKPSLVKKFVPYIVRASLSPLTLLAMTKAYFASLFNLNYLAEVSLVATVHG